MMQQVERLTPGQAWEKMKRWCSWSEKCQQDVYLRLRKAGLTEPETNELIARLIEEDYLNEERYARQFAGGHFRQKKWGREKISAALRKKHISPYCIAKAMEEIEEETHGRTLLQLAQKKWAAAAGSPPPLRWAKTRAFLLQKGYPSALVLQALQQLSQNKTQ
jgi:regulatory protein